MAARTPARPQNTIPASDEMLKLGPQSLSSSVVKGRQISSRQVDTKLIDVDGLNPCLFRTLVAWRMKSSSGMAPGKVSSRICKYDSMPEADELRIESVRFMRD